MATSNGVGRERWCLLTREEGGEGACEENEKMWGKEGKEKLKLVFFFYFYPRYLRHHKFKFCVAINFYKKMGFSPHKLYWQIFIFFAHT